MSWMFDTQELLLKAYSTHMTMYAYLPLSMGSWNIQEYLDSNIFWTCDGPFCWNFPPFCVFDRMQICNFFYCT